MFQFIYNQCLRGGPIRRRGFRLLRKLLLKAANPTVRIEYFGRTLEVPFNSDLAIHTSDHVTYNSNLKRLCSFVRNDQGALRMVDVGANIGDGAVLADPGPKDSLLLVEGFPAFAAILRRNLTQHTQVELAECYLSDRPADLQVSEVESNATNRLVVGNGRTVQMKTLDAVIEGHPRIRPVGLVKVDVDGFDGRVLSGAQATLKRDHPVILFEFHPSLWRKANERFDTVLPMLRELGYGPVVVYDNQGVLLMRANLSDEGLIHSLTRYARIRDFFYFDLAVFPESGAASAERFLASEETFFNQMPDGASS
jgi:FkbM family methyltransferase